MSQRTVQLLIGQIVTDEDLRRRFIERPIETLTALRDQGVDLTAFEIDALARTDDSMWEGMAGRIDPTLQRCTLRPESECGTGDRAPHRGKSGGPCRGFTK